MEVNFISKTEWIAMANYIIDTLYQKLTVGANNMQQPKLYTNKEACLYLNVCHKTLQNYRDNGQIEFSQTGRKIYYTQENLNAFLYNNKKATF